MTLRWFLIMFVVNFLVGCVISFVAPGIVIFSGIWWLKVLVQGSLGYWAAEIDERHQRSKDQGEHG